MIGLSTGEFSAPLETGNDIILDSDGKIWMQYVVSDPHPDLRDGIRGTTTGNLTASNTAEGRS